MDSKQTSYIQPIICVFLVIQAKDILEPRASTSFHAQSQHLAFVRRILRMQLLQSLQTNDIIIKENKKMQTGQAFEFKTINYILRSNYRGLKIPIHISMTYCL